MNGLLSVVIFIPPSMDALSFFHYLEIQDSWWFPITLYIDCIYPVFQSYQSALHVHLLPFDSTYILTCMPFSLLMRCIWGKYFSPGAALRTVFLVHTLSLHPYYLHLSSFLNCVDRFNFRGNGPCQGDHGEWEKNFGKLVLVLNSRHQARWQAFIPTKPSHQP